MYNKLNILTLFTDGYNRSLYVREVAKLLHLSPRTAQLILRQLEKESILESELKGKTLLYSLKQSDILHPALCLAESYKKLLFLKKHPKILLLEQKLSADIIIIFGSYAKGIEKKDSDIDLLIIGKYSKTGKEYIEKLYNLKVDIKHYPEDAFKDTDIIIRELIKHHIILAGTETIVQQILSLKYQLSQDSLQ